MDQIGKDDVYKAERILDTKFLKVSGIVKNVIDLLKTICNNHINIKGQTPLFNQMGWLG